MHAPRLSLACSPIIMLWGHRTLAREWRGHGAGVMRAIGIFGLEWRGRGAGMSCDPCGFVFDSVRPDDMPRAAPPNRLDTLPGSSSDQFDTSVGTAGPRVFPLPPRPPTGAQGWEIADVPKREFLFVLGNPEKLGASGTEVTGKVTVR
eukprot:gene17982-biopygen3901